MFDIAGIGKQCWPHLFMTVESITINVVDDEEKADGIVAKFVENANCCQHDDDTDEINVC